MTAVALLGGGPGTAVLVAQGAAGQVHATARVLPAAPALAFPLDSLPSSRLGVLSPADWIPGRAGSPPPLVRELTAGRRRIIEVAAPGV